MSRGVWKRELKDPRREAPAISYMSQEDMDYVKKNMQQEIEETKLKLVELNRLRDIERAKVGEEIKILNEELIAKWKIQRKEDMKKDRRAAERKRELERAAARTKRREELKGKYKD